MGKKVRGILIVKVIYLIALFAAWQTGLIFLNKGWSMIWWLAMADIAATVVVFAGSYIFKNSSIYDAYWSVIPIWIALLYCVLAQAWPEGNLRAWIAGTLVIIWGARLTWNWTRGWPGLDHQDWRYEKLEKDTGPMYWLVSFSGIHLMPTVLVFLGCLPLIPAMYGGTPYWSELGLFEVRPFGVLDIAAIVVTSVSILIETIADNQKRSFLLDNPAKGSFLKKGLWARSRHPNYLGEIGFWWGIYLFALAADPSWWWTGIGALCINALFVFISIPMMDERMVERREGYKEHMKKVRALLPIAR